MLGVYAEKKMLFIDSNATVLKVRELLLGNNIKSSLITAGK